MTGLTENSGVRERVAREIKTAHLQVRCEGNQLPLANFLLQQDVAVIARNRQKGLLPKI
jgi:hypothetical protein